MATVVFFHAHPDDEAIATGGTMARLSDEGHRVVLVSATAGELGETPEGLLGPGETLVERRRAELAEACRALGVHRHVELGYLDSGMAGEESNHRPGAFAAADPDDAAAALATILGDEQADVLVIYDEHGVYGHPDHVQVYEVGRRATEQAGTPVLYLVTLDRERMQELAASSGFAPPDEPDRDLEVMGEPGWRITTSVDVRPWVDRKRAAMTAHRSQIAPDSFFLAMPDDVFREVWGVEAYIRVRPAPEGFDGPREELLLLDPAAAGPTGSSAGAPTDRA